MKLNELLAGIFLIVGVDFGDLHAGAAGCVRDSSGQIGRPLDDSVGVKLGVVFRVAVFGGVAQDNRGVAGFGGGKFDKLLSAAELAPAELIDEFVVVIELQHAGSRGEAGRAEIIQKLGRGILILWARLEAQYEMVGNEVVIGTKSDFTCEVTTAVGIDNFV